MANYFDQFDEAPKTGNFFDQFDERSAEPARKSTIGSEVVRGGKQLASSIRTGVGALTGSPEEAALAGVERGDVISEEAGEGASLEAVKQAYRDRGLLSAAGEVVSQIPRAVAAQVPQLAAMAGGAKLGAMAGTAVAPGPGTVIGGALGAGASLLPQFFGANIERQASEQLAEDEEVSIDRTKAGAAAAGQTVIETAGTAFVLGKRLVKGVLGITDDAALMTAQAQKKMVQAAERSLLAASGRGAAVGAAIEIPVEIASSVLERAQAGLDVMSPDALAEYGEAAYQAALVGGPLGTVGGVTDTSFARQGVKAKAAADEAETKRIADAEQARLDTEDQTEIDSLDSDVESDVEPTTLRETETYVKPPSISGTRPDALLGERADPLASAVTARREASEPPSEIPLGDNYAFLQREKQRMLQEPSTPETKQMLQRIDTRIGEILTRDIEQRRADKEASKTSVFAQDDLPPVESRDVVVGNLELDQLQAPVRPADQPLTGRDVKSAERMQKLPTPVSDEQARLEQAEMDRRKFMRSKEAKQGNLMEYLKGKLALDEVSDIAPKGKGFEKLANEQGTYISELVSDGMLDEFLPPDQRAGQSNFDAQTAAETIKENLRNKNLRPFELQTQIRQLDEGVAAAELEAKQPSTAQFDLSEVEPGEAASVERSATDQEVGEATDIRYQRSTTTGKSIGKQQTQSVVDAVKAQWANAPEVVVAESMSDPLIPEAVRAHNEDALAKGAKGKPKGFFYKGKAYILADSMTSPNDAVETLFHESLGHFGLRGTFGPEMGKVLADVVKNRRADVEAKAKQYGLDVKSEKDMLEAAEEVLAEIAQTKPGLSFVKRAIAVIRNFLRDLGLPFKMSNEDIIQKYILPARAFVERGERRVVEGKPAAAREIKAERQIYKDAEAIAAMDEDVRDNMEVGQVPGGSEAYNLYEAKKLLKKPSDKLKRVTDNNSFSLWQDWEYIANVDGDYFGVTRETDPDALDGDEDSFVYAYARLDDPRNVKTTFTSNAADLFSEIRDDAVGAKPAAMREPAKATESEAKQADDDIRYQREATQEAEVEPTREKPTRQNIFGEPVLGTWSITVDPKMELQDGLIYKMLDKNIDVKRIVEAVKKTGKEIATKWNPYLQEELYHGRTAEASKLFQDNEWLPLLQDMQKKDVTIGEMEKYLLNRHAEDYNNVVAKRNPTRPEMQDEGSSVTTEAARKYLADLDADTKAKYEEVAKRVDGITKGTRKLLVDTGYEKAETIKGWEKAFPNYVPLMREEMDFDYNFGSFGTGRGFDVRRDFSRSAMGSKRNVVDIIGNVIAARNNAIALTEKNRVAQAVYGLALEAPSPDFWMAINPEAEKVPQDAIDELRAMGLDEDAVKFLMKEPKQRMLDPKKNEVISRVNSKLRENDFVLATRVNGEKRYVFFNSKDPRAARAAKALKNLDAQDLGTTMGMVAKVTRWMASVNTQYNPVFGPYNFLRDIQAGALQLSTTELAGQQKEIAKLVVPSMGAIYSSLRKRRKGEKVDSEMAKLWKEFQSEGGQTGFRDNFSRTQDRTEALLTEMEKLTEGKLKAGSRAVFDWLSDYNDSLENAVRLASYKVGRDKFIKEGASPAEAKQRAASLAKNLTVNFNRKGDVATQMGALYAFFNASMQGSARMLEALKGPMGKRIMGGGLLLGSMQAMLLAAAGFDDEEPPEFVRSKNLVIPLEFFGLDAKYAATPMPLGFHVIPGISRILTEWALSGFKDTGRRTTDLLGLFLDAFNPVGNSGWSAQTLTPTVLDPIVALGENRDFTGKPISKEDMFSLRPTPGYTRAREGANWLTTKLAEFLNAASGGTKYQPGAISPTPEQIEYLIGQATGGVGREAVKLATTVQKTSTGEDLPLYKIPLVGRFVGDTKGSAAESNKFYKNIERLNRLDQEIKGRRGDRQPVGEFMRDNPESRLLPLANKTYKDVQDLRKRRKALLERNAPKASIEAVEKLITRRMAILNERVKAMEGN